MPAPATTEAPSTGTVTVASKVPIGLVLQLQEPYTQMENVMGQMREVEYSRFAGPKYTLNKAAYRVDVGPRTPIIGGCALTQGIPAGFWAKWLKQNEDSEVVKKGHIFAYEKPADATAHAKEMKDELCGMEPVNPAKLPAEFTRKGSKIETAERD